MDYNNLPTRTKVLLGTLVFVCLLAVTSAGVNWYKPGNNQPTTFTPAPPITKLAEVPKVTISLPKVEVLDKASATKKLGPALPEAVSTNPDVEILSSATTGPTKAGYDIISTIDKNSGKSGIYYKEKQRSLVEFVNETKVGAAFGISTDGGKQVAKVYGEYTFFRVGDVHLSFQTDVRVKQLEAAEATGMVAVEYRFGK